MSPRSPELAVQIVAGADLRQVREGRGEVAELVARRPDLAGTDFTDYWVYVAGPLVGVVVAVGTAWALGGAAAAAPGSAACEGGPGAATGC